MEKEMKCCLMFCNSKIVPSFIKELEERLNTKIKTSSFCGRDTIYVHCSLYEKAIIAGTEILTNNPNYNPSDVSWVDFYNEIHSIGWILLLYGVLPKDRIGNIYWCAKPPQDIADFKQEISTLLGKECWIEYNGSDNAVTFCIHDMDYKKSLEMVTEFLKTKDSPFTEIKIYNFIGEVL